MLYSAIFLVLATLYTPCLAEVLRASQLHESPPQADANAAKYNCRYTVHTDTTLSNFQFPQDLDAYRSDPKSLEECTATCDTQKHCAAAAYYPHNPGGARYPKCLGVYRTGFSRVKLAPSKKKGNGVAQLVPNSCNKPVATPHPVGCTPGTQTDPKSGCKYKVSCNVELKREYPSTTSESIVKDNTAACFKYMRHPFGLEGAGYGYTFYQGGWCMVNTYKNDSFVPTVPRPNTQTIQLIPGSC